MASFLLLVQLAVCATASTVTLYESKCSLRKLGQSRTMNTIVSTVMSQSISHREPTNRAAVIVVATAVSAMVATLANSHFHLHPPQCRKPVLAAAQSSDAQLVEDIGS
ncbi:hypothetical protein GQ42DRAFT_160424 [Ramicandelaber brevisporus]|nr:hypothetical protein GQ42DRAFT_160424 [Ramicandelaber brevisporus]